LYVGPATTKRFARRGIYTIGDLAKSCPDNICNILRNKTGASLWAMAVGQDRTQVAHVESVDDIKSIGNSNTMPCDLNTDDDVRAAFYMLGESVSQRMRENGFRASTLAISIRDNELFSCTRQMKLSRPTSLTAEMVQAAMEIFKRNYRWYKPIRSVGIRGSDLVPENEVYQLNH
jgi:DNA polymerase-4